LWDGFAFPLGVRVSDWHQMRAGLNPARSECGAGARARLFVGLVDRWRCHPGRVVGSAAMECVQSTAAGSALTSPIINDLS